MNNNNFTESDFDFGDFFLNKKREFVDSINTKNSGNMIYENYSDNSQILPSTSKKSCKCKNSQCLKFYCDCFAVNKYCDPSICSCINCSNNSDNEVRSFLIYI